jgi:hypothetical protein
MRRALAALIGLGVVGGVGTVVYNHNGATVKIKGSNGQVQNVHISFSGKQFDCPAGTDKKANPVIIESAKIKLTIKKVSRELQTLKQKYRGTSPSRRAIAQYNALVRRGRKLVSAYNAEADRYNAIIRRDCHPASGG